MTNGIAIMGANGGGKSTLAHALANRIGYYEMDMEDYYFPEQKASRQYILEHPGAIQTEYLGELPFSVPRTKREVEDTLREDLQNHPQFVLSGVTMNWSEDIRNRIEIVFLVETPLEERLKRIFDREVKRFGSRVLPGGDMYEQQMNFKKVVSERDMDAVHKSAENLQCPIKKLDGTGPVEENILRMLKEINASE